MNKICKSKLKTLYKASEISDIWNASKNLAVINHSQYGWITPNQYRAKSKGKPCPYCGRKMVHGQELYSTSSKKEAIKQGYEYIDKCGNKVINRAGNLFFHPNYLTLDHKLNKARCPEKMFDHDNLECVCWRCNNEKGANNSFELQHNQNYLNSLADEAIVRYPNL